MTSLHRRCGNFLGMRCKTKIWSSCQILRKCNTCLLWNYWNQKAFKGEQKCIVYDTRQNRFWKQRCVISGGFRNFVWGSFKNLNEKNNNKKRTWIYWVIEKKNWSFTILFYKFSNFELLYDSSLWVFIIIVSRYDHFILLSLSYIFIFYAVVIIYLSLFL